jgi:hypothetical protein
MSIWVGRQSDKRWGLSPEPPHPPFGHLTGVEPRVSSRPSDPRRVEGGARGYRLQFDETLRSEWNVAADPLLPCGEKVAQRAG